ncbi:MAG: superoxide dismutase [Chthoniobacterales bacterium]
MSYTLPILPYASNALEPSIDSKTVEIHHDKHHAAYVTNLNNALKDQPELAAKPINELIANLALVPEAIRTAVRNNGGGHSNHSFYWELMTPGGAPAPVGTLAEALIKTFGSFEEFKTKFEAAGLARFGSGWVWLVKNKSGVLEILSTPNQDSPLMEGLTPIVGNDVWEHAYYLNYQNRRADYLKAWWSLVNWDVAEIHFASIA